MTEPVSRQILEVIMAELKRLEPPQAEALTNQFKVEQPALFYYLDELIQLPFGLDRDEDIFLNGNEANHIFFIGLVLWHVLNQQRGQLRPLTWEDIDDATEATELPFGEPEEPRYPDILPLLDVDAHPEPALARFLIEAVSPWRGDEDFQPIHEDNRPLMLVLFHTVLNALLRAVEKADPKRSRSADL